MMHFSDLLGERTELERTVSNWFRISGLTDGASRKTPHVD